MAAATRIAMRFAENGLLPDSLIRAGIRRLCRLRLREIGADDPTLSKLAIDRFIRQMEFAPVAVQTRSANEQHYEVPPAFFEQVLGPRMKYSSCWWALNNTSLAQAEEDALLRSADYAALENGQDVLELGCGWGSLTLWMAERYPQSRIVAVSNSSPQRMHIERLALARGLRNVEVITCDMNRFSPARRFDRVVSIEMFEHMRNWGALFHRVHSWLRPGGRFYMHVFCHRNTPYLFEPRDDTDWMSRHFFAGGMMPSDELPLHLQQPLRLEQRWIWDGTHYARTAEAWLRNLDQHRHLLPSMLEGAPATEPSAADLWVQRWRIFFMACAELFGYGRGQEWWVSHYRFCRTEATS